MIFSSLVLVTLHGGMGLDPHAIFLAIASFTLLVTAFFVFSFPQFLIRFIGRQIAHLIYRIKIKGGQYIPEKGPALLVSNHLSYVDWLFLGVSLKRPAIF